LGDNFRFRRIQILEPREGGKTMVSRRDFLGNAVAATELPEMAIPHVSPEKTAKLVCDLANPKGRCASVLTA
jgi:hypothetical protein